MILARVAAAWLAGIAAAATLGNGAWPLAFALAALLLAWSLLRRDRRGAIYALALPIVFVLAVARFEISRPHVAADAISHYNDGVAMRVRRCCGMIRTSATQPSASPPSARGAGARGMAARVRRCAGDDGPVSALQIRRHARDGGHARVAGRRRRLRLRRYLAQRGIDSTLAFPRARSSAMKTTASSGRRC